jgi:hypothetical protein
MMANKAVLHLDIAFLLKDDMPLVLQYQKTIPVDLLIDIDMGKMS